jgi:alginate O-acetyltransferase complex protein AlgI
MQTPQPVLPPPEAPPPDLAYFRGLHELLPAPFFNTQAFLVFFAAVALVYWLTPRRWNTVRVWWLVVASFHFYAAWSYELAFLVLGTTVADYTFARLMDDDRLKRLRLLLLLTSVGMNLGVLCYFKYCDFFLGSINTALTKAGYNPAFAALTVMIPFGISFYTFEAISYAVDVYRRKIRAERSLPHFVLFILFFPHLVAGPIVRAGDFLRQAHRPKRWNWLRVQAGVQLFLLGVFKKMAIADRMAQFCDPVLAAPTEFNTSAVWLAVLAYAVRIYADFSGYSDMALGLAHLLGYRLTVNFNLPYLSANVSEFWRRWHISLSSWLRDYLFIPLGGSRGNSFATSRNLMLTMLLGGLWHGAAWSYVIWGGLHGLFLIAHRQFRGWCESRPRLTAVLESVPGTGVRILVTFVCVSLAWVFFRPDVQGSLDILARMFAYSPGKPLLLSNRSLWWTVGFVFACMWLWRWGVVQRVWAKLPPTAMGGGYAACLTAAMLLAPPVGKTFIYFTF